MKKLWLVCMLISSTINAQTFDFSCVDPFAGYIAEFIADSPDKSLNIEGRLLTRDEIAATGVTISGPGTIAFAYRCSPSSGFVYVKEHWDNHTPTQRKRIIYHEIGHALYGYPHPTIPGVIETETGTMTVNYVQRGFNGYQYDIMGYRTNIGTHWEAALIRFFAGTDHPPIRNCSANRGETIIEN